MKQSEELRGSRLHYGMLPGWGVANSPARPLLCSTPPGVVVSNGQRWWTLRSFALGALKEFGLGTRTIKDSVLEEAPCLLGEFQDSFGTAWSEKDRDLLWVWPLDTCCGCGLGKAFGWNEASKPKGWVGAEPQAFDLVMFPLPGAPFDPWRLLDNAVSHVMCSVVFENRYGYEDPEFLRFLDLFNDNFRIMSSRWGEVRGSAPIPPSCAQSMPNSKYMDLPTLDH